MEFFVTNKQGKITHILGLEAELVSGLLLLGVGALGVFWLYLDSIFLWLAGVLGMPY